MKVSNLSILFALSLIGCGSYSNQFDCPIGSGPERASFTNCVKKESDGDVFKGVSDCGHKQKELGVIRSKDLCVHVGTYCAEKDPITQLCLEKKFKYCCFESKLARLVQEQGRKQLGLTFGDTDNPICRGLTVEELTRIDFEKIDLSGLFSEISKHSQTSDRSKAASCLDRSKTKTQGADT